MDKELQAGTVLSHYRIMSKLGAGGMGEVYLAQDTSELGRNVALKILPAEVADNKDRLQRFIQEARTVSNLNHPNILTVHEFGKTESASFMATEFVDGVTLRQHVSNRRLKLVELIDVAIQIVAALNAAHEAGITHRDLKPENVMIRKDHIVKVLDFGLAKPSVKSSENAIDSEAGTKVMVHTEPGIVMGTVSYMSPEQSVGKGVDHRTDIWSVGVVLYEMFAGVVPFPGKDIHRQIIAIQEAEPAPLSQQVEGVPERLEEIVTKCLAKEKDERYQTAKDLLIDLRNLRRKLDVDAEIERTVAPALRSPSGAASQASTSRTQTDAGGTNLVQVRSTSSAEYIVTGIRQHKLVIGLAVLLLLAGSIGLGLYLRAAKNDVAIKSIAVLPFVNEGGNADIEYLSDGMTETLINSLSRIPNLNVKARSSVFRYKGKEIDLKKIAADLGVQAVLIGRVVERGDQLTLNLELIDGLTENVLWGNRYERKSSQLVALQSEIARDVSNKLKTKLSGEDAAKVEKSYTANAEAYQLFLKGRFYASKRTAKDAQKAIEYYQQAVAIDPNYALAFAGLAEANWFLALYSYPQVNEAIPRARELALKALELDNSLAEPHSVLGVICSNYDHDFACMEREQKLAIELNPNYSEGHRRYGLLLEDLGRFEEARVALRRALEIDPLSPVTNFEIAHLLFYERKYEESEAQSKKNVELDPNFWYAHLQLFYVYRMKRDYPSAVEELAKVQDARGEPDAAKLIRESFAGENWQGFLRTITDQRVRLKLYPYFVAGLLAELGEKDKAFSALNEALATKDQHIRWMKSDPFMDPLRGDPRFQGLLKRAGFPD